MCEYLLPRGTGAEIATACSEFIAVAVTFPAELTESCAFLLGVFADRMEYVVLVLRDGDWGSSRVRMVRGGLATQDLRQIDQWVCKSVGRGAGHVLGAATRCLVLLSAT